MAHKKTKQIAKKVAPYTPARGDVCWIQLNPILGHEQSGRRPVVFLTPSRYTAQSGMALVCPITSREQKYALEHAFTGTHVRGTVLVDHTRSVDWKKRGALFIESMPERDVEVILRMLGRLLDPYQPV